MSDRIAEAVAVVEDRIARLADLMKEDSGVARVRYDSWKSGTEDALAKIVTTGVVSRFEKARGPVDLGGFRRSPKPAVFGHANASQVFLVGLKGDIQKDPDAVLLSASSDSLRSAAEEPQDSDHGSKPISRRIFIVHGHDETLKSQLARLLQRLDFDPVILHEQPNRGQTLLEKLLRETADVGYAFVLLTPDDTGGPAAQTKGELTPRARQNVVFEHGLLLGKLGPSRVCAIVSNRVEIPSDLQGVVYEHLPAGAAVDSIALSLIRELRAAGYDVDANRV